MINRLRNDITTLLVRATDLTATQLGGTAVGNAVYHVVGRRVRDLPITVEKLLV